MAQPNGAAQPSSLPALCESAADFLQHKYDYVIAGGGTAGLVVAARLTENPDVTVGVLEGGKCRLDDMFVDTPALFAQTLHNPEYDWIFESEPDVKHGVRHHIPRGKLLGGSSGVNLMMYVRGSNEDYDDWAAITEDLSWDGEHMKQYMRKHQTLDPIDEKVVDRSILPFVGENHGTSGPIHTSFNASVLPIEESMIKAADEACGLTAKPIDPWSGDHIGFYSTLGCIARTGRNKGKRSYAARGYFEDNAHRPNLHVLCEAFVTSIKLDGDKAVGVNFTHAGTAYCAEVRREVILSCGTIQSPQLLELSGIGDPVVLQKVGIECKIENSAVGANLQDHILAMMAWDLTPGTLTFEAVMNPEIMADAQKQLQESQAGPLTQVAGTQGFFPFKVLASGGEYSEILKLTEESMSKVTPFQRKQYERTLLHLKSDKSANIQMLFVPITPTLERIDNHNLLFERPPGYTGMGGVSAVGFQYPLSRGTVHVKSSDPKVPPTIDPNWLGHPADTAVLGVGLKLFADVEQSKHMTDKIDKRHNAGRGFDLHDTQQARAYADKWHSSEYHLVGTCAMGDAVDTRLRVKGARNLRVVDASIFPNHVSGNIQASVYAVAEKAADLIKEDWDYAALSSAGQKGMSGLPH